jgi:hypothetical protein
MTPRFPLLGSRGQNNVGLVAILAILVLAVLVIIVIAGRQTRTPPATGTPNQSTTQSAPNDRKRVDIDVNLPDSVVIKP